MTFTDEQLSAYLDGALPEAEMNAITDAMAQSDALTERLAALQDADTWLRDKFTRLDERPVREETLALIEAADGTTASQETNPEANNVISFKPRAQTKPQRGWPAWGQAVAASITLAVGIITGMQLEISTNKDSTPLQMAGLITSDSPLYSVLQHTESMQVVTLEDPGMTATPTMSFASTDGNFCREFTLSASSSESRNLACRVQEGWIVQVSVSSSATPTDSESYVPANAQDRLLDEAILSLISGDVLSPSAEKKAINKDWQ